MAKTTCFSFFNRPKRRGLRFCAFFRGLQPLLVKAGDRFLVGFLLQKVDSQMGVLVGFAKKKNL